MKTYKLHEEDIMALQVASVWYIHNAKPKRVKDPKERKATQKNLDYFKDRLKRITLKRLTAKCTYKPRNQKK